VLLHHAKPKVSHPDAPVTHLLAHAIELYLKAFLRLRGLGAGEVKTSFGHNFQKLVDEASARGLDLMDEDLEYVTEYLVPSRVTMMSLPDTSTLSFGSNAVMLLLSNAIAGV
jgi:hypothetical protein